MLELISRICLLVIKGIGAVFLLIYQIVFSVIAVVYVIAIFVVSFKYGLMLKGLLLSGIIGIALLTLLKIFEIFIGLKIYINVITVLLSAIFGPCGVILCLLIDYFVI